MSDSLRPTEPSTDRVRLRRGANRAVYGRDEILAVLDAALIAHVGVTTADGPIVLPMAFGRTDECLYLHGSAANAALRAAIGHDICATVTIVDALIVARSAFHNSMNYRGVVVRGVARKVDDPAEHLLALQLVTDHVVANWGTARTATERELRQTLVIALPLDEMSAKIRTGDPVDDEADLDGPHWSGRIPIRTTWETPIPSGDLWAGIATPESIAALAGRSL